MFKKMVVAVVVLTMAVSFGACKKKEEKPQLPPGHPSMEGGMPPAGGMPEMPKVDRQVIVPKEVKAKYSAVKLSIEDKATKGVKEYTVGIGSELAVPNTKMKVKVLAFLPDFRMGEKDITSASDKPNNPAAQILVTEPGKEEWKGFIYSMHPGIHPFQHEKVGITLIGGVTK